MNTDDTDHETRRQRGDALRAARVSMGLRQVDLADVLGITPQYLSMVENGRRPLSRPKVRAAAQYLGVPERHLHDPARFPADLTSAAGAA